LPLRGRRDEGVMDLICYLYPGWKPNVRPAPPSREWMDNTPEAFAYRCLPLNIANAHGWEVLSPVTFEAIWNGDPSPAGVTLNLPEGTPQHIAPVSLFGQGTITFHVQGLFRTPPGWNLFLGGSPNSAKDGIAPLSGVVETDWSPYTFTMNWRFTRPNHWVRFEEGEPICFLFPVQRGVLETIEPRFVPIENEAELKADFELWSVKRDEFHVAMRDNPPAQPADKWQKNYYRGVDPHGKQRIEDHKSKLRLAPFTPAIEPHRHTAPPQVATILPVQRPEPAAGESTLALKKREWLLDVIEAHQHLAPDRSGISRYEGLTSEEFLNDFYAQQRPVIIGGEMEGWKAREWTPEYMARKVGSAPIEFQGDRAGDPAFELMKDAHKRQAPFDQFMRGIQNEDAGNNAYMTAYNSATNRATLAPLYEDLGIPDKLVTSKEGMMWIGPAGTFTPLHHDLTNNLIGQVKGDKQIIISPAADVARLRNRVHVFSEFGDLAEAFADLPNNPELAGLRAYDVTLKEGDFLFVPIGWWHQVRGLTFSVTMTYTNFRWRNDWSNTYPAE
jgi:hypothetical protein